MKASTTTPMGLGMALVAGVVALILSSACTVDGTVVTTCYKAVEIDGRVDLDLCMRRVGGGIGDTKNEDAWALAKDASSKGLFSVSQAGNDVKILLSDKPSAATMPALGKCKEAYPKAFLALGLANDEINKRNQAGARSKLDEGLAEALQCYGAWVAGGMPVPEQLARDAAESINLAIIAGAILNLAK